MFSLNQDLYENETVIIKLFQQDDFRSSLGLPQHVNPFASQNSPYRELSLAHHTAHTIKYLANMFHGTHWLKRAMCISGFFHDLGKLQEGIAKPHKDDENITTYYGHEDESAKIAEKFLTKLYPDDKELILFVKTVVKNHMYPKYLVKTNKAIDKYKRRCIEDCKGLFPEMPKFVIYHALADRKAHKLNLDINKDEEYLKIKEKLSWI